MSRIIPTVILHAISVKILFFNDFFTIKDWRNGLNINIDTTDCSAFAPSGYRKVPFQVESLFLYSVWAGLSSLCSRIPKDRTVQNIERTRRSAFPLREEGEKKFNFRLPCFSHLHAILTDSFCAIYSLCDRPFPQKWCSQFISRQETSMNEEKQQIWATSVKLKWGHHRLGVSVTDCSLDTDLFCNL